ncbi:unnamed protein product [Echinostoma caproni]|uniref:G_PROTEIN_RECEP_F1_2 domain-containing protein n=1 Tax=Echinostoma caproni TaxID=27848 RepID=A0A183A5U4_9TREM|nr:unnamed protein product [Echinostoma caproni]
MPMVCIKQDRIYENIQYFFWFPSACDLYGFSGGLFGFASLTTMVMISLERYFTIVWYVEPRMQLNHRRAWVTIAFIWIWAAIWPSPPLFGIGRYVLEGFHTSCSFDYISRDWPNLIFNTGLYIFGFALPVMVITLCYFEIVRFVRRNERELVKLQERSNDKSTSSRTPGYRKVDVDAAKSAVLIIALFLMAWLPYATVCAAALFGCHENLNPFWTELPGLFAKTSAIYNPFIYMIKNPNFRRKLWQKFGFFHWCLPRRRVSLNYMSLEEQK